MSEPGDEATAWSKLVVVGTLQQKNRYDNDTMHLNKGWQHLERWGRMVSTRTIGRGSFDSEIRPLHLRVFVGGLWGVAMQVRDDAHGTDEIRSDFVYFHSAYVWELQR